MDSQVMKTQEDVENVYTKQATDFLAKTGATFKAEFKKYGKHFHKDTDERDIYTITLTRGDRSFTFDFGQSLNCSGRFWAYGNFKRGVSNGKECKAGDLHGHKFADGKRFMKPRISGVYNREWEVNKDWAVPSAYCVLAGMTKYDVGTFADFCGDFGYDEDSRTAGRIYKAAVNEWQNVAMLWNEAEIEDLQEIQ